MSDNFKDMSHAPPAEAEEPYPMEAIALMHLYVSKQPPNFRTYFSLSRERHTFRNTLTAAVVALTALLLSGDLLHLLGNWKLWGLHVIFFYSEKKKSREFF